MLVVPKYFFFQDEPSELDANNTAYIWYFTQIQTCTSPMARISRLKYQVLKPTFLT